MKGRMMKNDLDVWMDDSGKKEKIVICAECDGRGVTDNGIYEDACFSCGGDRILKRIIRVRYERIE